MGNYSSITDRHSSISVQHGRGGFCAQYFRDVFYCECTRLLVLVLCTSTYNIMQVYVYATQLHMVEAFMHMPRGVVGGMHTSLLSSGSKFHAQCKFVGEEYIIHALLFIL